MSQATSAEAGLVSARIAPGVFITLLMVLNIHVAHDALLHDSFLSRGDGLPVPGGLMALAIGGKRLPLSLTKRK